MQLKQPSVDNSSVGSFKHGVQIGSNWSIWFKAGPVYYAHLFMWWNMVKGFFSKCIWWICWLKYCLHIELNAVTCRKKYSMLGRSFIHGCLDKSIIMRQLTYYSKSFKYIVVEVPSWSRSHDSWINNYIVLMQSVPITI